MRIELTNQQLLQDLVQLDSEDIDACRVRGEEGSKLENKEYKEYNIRV